MFEILSITALLLAALAVYWRGRRVLRHVDEPSFPQLHFAKGQLLSNALALGLIVSMLLSTRASGAKLLLLIVAVLVADYPYRRKLFGETWGLVRYLAFQLRFGLVTVGLLLAIALLPVVARSAGDWAIPVAVALALATAAAMHGHPQLARWMLRAQPLGSAELESRFAEVIARADTRVPHVWRFAARGGHMMNAFAMTSAYRPAVLLSEGLLQVAGPREATAIFAHEVAHLEEAPRGKRLRDEAVVCLELVLGVLFVVFLGPGVLLGDLLQWLYALVIVILASRQERSREAEFRSDLRAVELCGDPQAMIDVLDKIHLLNHQPRHWSPEIAAKLTHPSLAQRIRAIREACGLEQETVPLDTPETAAANELVVVSTDGSGTLVGLTADRVHWLRGVPQGTPLTVPALLAAASDQRTLHYSELSDLRHEVRGLGQEHRLVAIEPGKKPQEVGFGAEIVPQLKRHLRTVDHLFASTARGAQPPSSGGLGSLTLRLDGLLMALLALFPFSGSLLMMALAVVLFPGQAALAAAGSIAVLGSVLELWMGRGSWFLQPEFSLISFVTRIVFGSLLLVGAWQRYRRGDIDPRGTPWIALLPLLAVATVSSVWGGLRLFGPFPWEALYRWASPGPGLLFAGIGLVAVLATLRRRWVWLLIALWMLVAFGVLLAGRPWLVKALGEDPWFDPGPATRLPSLETEDVRTVRTSDRLAEIELSRGGRLLLRSYPNDYVWESGQQAATDFAVELEPDHWWKFSSLDASFLDDDRLLVLEKGVAEDGLREDGKQEDGLHQDGSHEDGDDYLTLSVRSLVPSSEEGFEIRLQTLETPRLRVWLEDGTWQVTGVERGEPHDSVVLIRGGLGSSTDTLPQIQRWRLPREGLGQSPHLATPHGAIASTTDFGVGGPSLWLLWSGASLGQTRVQRLVSEDRPPPAVAPLTTSCEVLCDVLPGEAGRLVCIASDSDRSTLWSVTLADEPWNLELLARFPASYGVPEVQPDGRVWIAGVDSASVLFDPATGEGWRVRRQDTTDAMEGDPRATPRRDPVSRWLDRTFTGWRPGAWIVHGASHGDYLAVATYATGDDLGLGDLEITVTSRAR